MKKTDWSYRYDIRDLQVRGLSLLDEVDRVCREHGLKYYIIAGTLLGALRHKGYIPWDDDIDIALMRDDYDTLVEHSREWLQEPYSIMVHTRDDRYPKFFGKLEDRSTTLVESFYLGYAGGVYMDIFPLDDVPDNRFLRNLHFYHFNFLRRLLYIAYKSPYKHGRTFGTPFIILFQKVFSKKWLHKRAQAVMKEYHGHKNCNYVMTHDDGTRAYHKSVFGNPVTVQFEDRMYCAPANPDGFLSVLYGNYMELPPLEQRRAHYDDYCDLNTPNDGSVSIQELERIQKEKVNQNHTAQDIQV